MANRDLYLNGALLKKNSVADFSSFTDVKLADLTATPADTSAATVKYVKDQLQVLSSGTVAGQTTQLADHATQLDSHTTQLADHTTQLDSHDTRILAEKARIDAILLAAGPSSDSFVEIVESINNLHNTQGADILTKFNDLQSQLNLFYSYFNQTRASIADHLNDPKHPNYVWTITMTIGDEQILDASASFDAGSTIVYTMVSPSQQVVILSDGNKLTANAEGTTSVEATGMRNGSTVTITGSVTVSA